MSKQYLVYPRDTEQIIRVLNDSTYGLGRYSRCVFITQIDGTTYNIRVAADSSNEAVSQFITLLRHRHELVVEHTQGGRGSGLRLRTGIPKLYAYARPYKIKTVNEF